jgi:hypothetical protein
MRIMRFAEAHNAGSLYREVGKEEMARLMSRETAEQFTKGDLDSLVGAFERADWNGEVQQLFMKFDKMAQRQDVFRLGIDLFDHDTGQGCESINANVAFQNMRENGWRLGRTRRQPNRIVVTCENLNKMKGAADWSRGNKHVVDVKFIDIPRPLPISTTD